MKKLILASLSLTFLGLSQTAFASDDLCHVPANEWVGKEAVIEKMTAEGWTVRKVKEEDGCYEVYAIRDGKRAELYLDPKTLSVVKAKEED